MSPAADEVAQVATAVAYAASTASHAASAPAHAHVAAALRQLRRVQRRTLHKRTALAHCDWLKDCLGG